MFLFFLTNLSAQTIDFGKSYINVTKGLNGGTVEPGDELEIRASFVVRPTTTVDSCGYFDVVPAGTVYVPGTLRVLTNEGKVYKQFTDAWGDDAGYIQGSNIRINLGYTNTNPATAFRRGRVANTHKPKFSNTCIMIASFHVKVGAAIPYNTNISTGGGSITYKNAVAGAPVITYTFPDNIVRIYQNFGICSNTIGGNALGTEFNGTFGSGKPRNRGTSANVPPGYTYSVFTTGAPNDYFYGIANNTSTNVAYTTSNAWAIPDNSSPTHRVFTVWDIIGDHTGASNPILGNPPADTVANNNGGYMLVINAAYKIDSAFQQTISNLCPNTYYEISCWMRNICSKCGSDSNGVGGSSGNAAYIPTGPGDTSGVKPNLTFEVDGIDYYTTGNLQYNGQWVKKGFGYLTGPLQTSFTLKFFNNAPGGGGNDWALDDISVATCSPNLTLFPSADPVICQNNVVNMSALVTSYFNNYTYYRWQKSTDNGVTWVNDGAAGTGVPTGVPGNWQYTVTHPAFIGTLADNGTKYRLVVATTAANLNNTNCAFSETTVITLHVIDCGNPLYVDFLSFTGSVPDRNAVLQWTTATENNDLSYSIEKSVDGNNFTTIGAQQGNNNTAVTINTYHFTDPLPLNGTAWYRIKSTNSQGASRYTRIIELNNNINEFDFGKLINPFHDQLEFELLADKNGKALISITNMSGNKMQTFEKVVNIGVNKYTLNTQQLLPGMYILRIIQNEKMIQRKIVKN